MGRRTVCPESWQSPLDREGRQAGAPDPRSRPTSPGPLEETRGPWRSRRKATHQQTRAHNVGLVLRALYDFGPISRADVARLSGLTRTTVGDVVGELIEDGLAREVGRGPSTGGKAPILARARRRRAPRDRPRPRRERVPGGARRPARPGPAGRRATGRAGSTATSAWPSSTSSSTSWPARRGERPSSGIGVGTPGIVDAATGTIRWAVNLDWQDLPLGDILRERYGVPVEVANDSRAAALAIELFSAASPARDRTSSRSRSAAAIGAGVVLGGELFHGDGFGAGEIGHMVVEDDGAECRCGRFGCLETVASSRAILRACDRVARRTCLDRRLGRRLAPTGRADPRRRPSRPRRRRRGGAAGSSWPPAGISAGRSPA